MKMITDLQDDVVTPNVLQLGDKPLTDISVEPGSVLRDDWDGVSDAITMQAESAVKAQKMQQLVDVAFAKAGDKEAVKRVEADALWGWTLTKEAAADAENTEDVLGSQLARRYGTGNPGAVWDAMNASADYEYEQMPSWNTRAEGMRLVWGRFQKMVQGKKAEADAAQAAINERMKGLEAYTAGKEAVRDESGKLADDAVDDGVLWKMVEQGYLSADAVQRAQKVRAFMQSYVLPLGKLKEMDERMRGLDGLRDEVYELIGDDKDTAAALYDTIMRWAGEQRELDDTGAWDEFQVAIGKKFSDWSRAVDVAAPLALLSVGAPGPVAPALAEQAVGTYERRRATLEQQRLSAGILRAGIDEVMKLQEGSGVWGSVWQGVKNAPRLAARLAGDTAPYFLPGVGAFAGSADVAVRGLTSGMDARVLDAELGGNKGRYESRGAMYADALVESGIQALVELMPWSRLGGKGVSGWMGKKMQAVSGGRYVPGALTRAVARGTQSSLTRALVTEGLGNVVTEGLLEPIASGSATLVAEGLMDMFGVEHGQSASFAEAFAELGEMWEPEQLAGFLLFSAALTAPAYWQSKENVRLYRANAERYAKRVESWELQGLSAAAAEEAVAAEDSLTRGNELVAEGWKNDPDGMQKRMQEKHAELKASGRTLVFAGVGGKGDFDADTVKLLGESWRLGQKRFYLPEVELLGDGKVKLFRKEVPGVVDGIDLTLTEEQADAFLFGELNKLNAEQLKDWQEKGGSKEEFQAIQTRLADLVDRAMGDVAVDAAVSEGSMDVEAMGKGLPEEFQEMIRAAGGMTVAVAKSISEWAAGRVEALVEGGMSARSARAKFASEAGGATLGELLGLGSGLAKRERDAGFAEGSTRTALHRRRGGRRVVQYNGRSVLGSVLVHARGGATGLNAVEDISESVFDMMVQERAQVILENQAAAREAAGGSARPATLTEEHDAEEQAWSELAEVARKAREALLKVDGDLNIEEVDGSRLNTIEALSTMALSRYVGSGVLPGWMNGLQKVLRDNVQAAHAVAKLQEAMVALGEKSPAELKELLDWLDAAGVQVGKSLSAARADAVVSRMRELERWNAGAVAAGPGGAGGMSVSRAQEEVLEEEDAIQQNDRAREAVAAAKPADAAKMEDAADREVFVREAAKGSVPGRMKGVFVGDAGVYNAAGDFWCGEVDKNKLSDGTEQVKVGEKGKHGVIKGKELTGRFVNDTAPILLWKRRDGALQVISGRHRFAKLMEDGSATSIMCYVYEESAERDEKWARMKDFEQNMRDDQADEVTCAVYARETGLTEAEMRERGLTRNGSRSKRGIFIGQHAREELWTRFRNGEVKPMDAELVCKLTAALADQSQVAEIQAHCCGLLKAGKSWDYIGASVQLMASSQAQRAEQMLLDLGADFTANLERMARWVELCRKAFREAIDLLKDEKRRVKKGAKASRLGLSATMTEEKREEMLGDLVAMDAKFEMIGSYPELVAEAKLWDGDESKFADPVAMYLERVEAMQAEGLQEEQDRKAAEEATGMFNWSSSLTGGSPAQNIDASMSGLYPKGSIIYINGREVDLSQCYAIDSSGNKLNKDDFITTPAGNINWYEFPSDEHTRQMMKKKGVKVLPVRLRVGVQQKTSGAGGYGFMHVMKHYNQMVDMNPSESPLMHLFNTLTGKLSITKNGILRKTMDSANNGQARKLVIELKEDEGFYSIVSSYPVSYYPRESNGIAIKGVYLKFMPGRAASGLNESNQADSTTPESTGVTGQSLTGSIPKNAKSVNIYDLKILEKDGALVFQQKQEEKVNLASYSVTGGKNLAAVHSLSAEKFLSAVELGGMPMPSVAVTRLDRPYEWGGNGNIYLVGKPEMVDPRKGTTVHSADAWAGYIPRLVHKVAGVDDRRAASSDLYRIKQEYQYNKDGDNTLDMFMYRIDEGEKTERYDMGERLRSDAGKILFAWQSGYRPRAKKKDAKRDHEWLTRQLAKELQEYTKLPVLEYAKIIPEIDKKIKPVIEAYYAEMDIVKKAPTPEAREKWLNRWVDAMMRAFWRDTPGLLARELGDVENIGRRVLDTQGNLAMLARYADKHKKAYEAWVEEKLNKWYSKERYIEGSRKEATLDNITRYMLSRKGLNNEAGMGFSSGKVRAARSVQMRSLEDIKERRDTLTDSATSNDAKERTNELMMAWREGVAKILNRNKTWYDSSVYDDAMKALANVSGVPSADKLRKEVKRLFRSETKSKVDEVLNDAGLIKTGVDALIGLRAELEDYMEAIPQRAVKMDEWEYAVLPVGLKKNKAVVAALRENGIKPVWHDGTEEGRRAALAGLVDDPVVSFSVIGRKAKTWDKYVDRAFAGRDDGLWRAEIDASQAKLKMGALVGNAGAVYRKLVAGDDMPDKTRAALMQLREDKKVLDGWYAAMDKGEEHGDAYMKKYLADDWLDRYQERSSLVQAYVRNTLLYAGVSGEGKYGSLAKGSRLVGTVFNSMLAGDVNEDLAKVLDTMSKKRNLPLGELLDYPELYEAYPDLKSLPVYFEDLGMFAKGKLELTLMGDYPDSISVNEMLDGESLRSTLLHEVQHAIQSVERFAQGGSPSNARRALVARAGLAENDELTERLKGKSDGELYLRLAGEIEARNVQLRRNWSAEKRAAIPFNDTLEYPGEALVTYSLTGAVSRVLEDSGDEYVANRLREAWQKNLEKWSVLNAGKADSNSAMRAVMEMEGLVKATYDVVEGDAKLGRLYMLQRWAMVYARMVESGEIPPKGALKGQAYERFVERLTEEQRTEMRRGMSREQAEGLVRELGVTRLEGAMERVARECMRAAEWHLKQKETERVHRLLEAAWPKREEGKKSPRGKLEAREYRRLEWIKKVMELSAEDKYKETQRIIREIDELPQELVGYEERVAELEGKLAVLEPKQADYVERKAELDKAMRELNPNEVGYDEAKAELEDQLNWLHVFGGWSEMDVTQARKAAKALEDLLLRGRTEWELKLQRERERTRKVALEISSHFDAKWYETTAVRKADADTMGTNKAKMLKGLKWGLMGYAQTMLALRRKLGKVFCDRQRRTLAEAHRNLLTAQKDLQDWTQMELQKITGLTGAALEQWIAGNNQNVNTGIMMHKVRTESVRMSAKEVDRLMAMGSEEYEAWLAEEYAKAEVGGRAVVLPTREELLRLADLRRENPRRQKLEVMRTEDNKVPLVATKEALLYAVLLFEQPDYEHLVEAHGLTGEDVDAMKKIIGPKLLRWGYAMRRHLNENGELLAAKYEAWNGTPFGRRANYFRGVFDVNKLKPETDIIDEGAAANSLGGNKYSILIPRRYHRQQINWQVGASQVFMLTMNEQNNYIHTQHITREWRQLLSRKGFADGLAAQIGTNAVNMIKLHLDVIDAAPRADAAMTSLFGRLVQGVMKATAISSLALNVYSYVKQVSCFLNAVVGGYVPDAVVKQSGAFQVLSYSGIGAGELIKSYGRVLRGKGAISFREMTGSRVIQSRIQSGGKRVADALMLRTGQKLPNAVGRAGEVSGEWALEQMDMIDRKANTVAAMVVADAVYRKLAATEAGQAAGDKWLRAQAEEAAGLMVDLVAQPKLRTQKGLWASHGGFFGGVGNFFYMFRSESLAKIGTYIAQMSSGDYAKALGGFMSMGVGLWFVNLLCSYLKGQIDGDDLDDTEDVLKFARKSVTEVIFGDLASLPIVGGGIGAAKAAVGGTWHYVNDPLQMILPVSDLWKRPKQLYKAVDKDGIWSFKAMRALCNCLRVGGNASGWGLGTGSAVMSSAAGIILGAAVMGNAGRFVLDVAERVTEE